MAAHADEPKASKPSDAAPDSAAPNGAATEPREADRDTPANAATVPSGSAATGPAATEPSALPAQPAALEAPTPAPAEKPEESWFSRPAFALSAGEGAKKLTLTFYGFIEADYIADTTRSYSDGIGGSLVARHDTYAGRVGRTQFSMRNTRLGLLFESPVVGGIKPSAVLESDFFGNQPSNPPSTSESAFFDSPTFRLRHAYFKLQNDYVDVLIGQTYDVFGFQNYFFPCSAEFLGLPNQLFSRHAQLRLSHTFGSGGPVTLDIAAAAVRPAQRDSSVPDANAGIRLGIDSWKGITTPGNVGTVALPASIGVSGVVRQFKVNAFTPPPAQNSNQATGWGLSVDALIPVIPAQNSDDRGNRLTLTGSFVTGSGISDLINAEGGAAFPTLPNPAQANPPPTYDPNIDNGLVSFDTQGVVHTIDWQAFRVGLQYYFPGSGRVIFSANVTQAHSKNMAQLFPKGGAEIELLGRVADTSLYGDANLFWDATPAVRLGLSGQYTTVKYLDGDKPHNIRGMAQGVYVF